MSFILRKSEFEKPSAKEIFQVILLEPEKYKENQPLKNVRDNKIYTNRNCSLDNITCDDNGAYRSSNNNKKLFYIQINGSSLNVKLVHQENGKFFYKEKNGRT